MSGKLIIIRNHDNAVFKTSFYYDSNVNSKHNHIFFKLNNGLVLVYNDIRRFGFFKFYQTTDLNKIKFLKNLGPEPFSKKFNKDFFQDYIKKVKKNIKNLLMDQNFVSGLGNIYVNEALFLSKIMPTRDANSLTNGEIKNLVFI